MKQIVEVRPAAPGNPLELVFGLGDEKGAAVLVISTGWGIDNEQNSTMNAYGTQAPYYPTTTGLWWHTPNKPAESEDHYWCHREHCEYLGKECWSQIISDREAGELFGLLRREGLGKLWIALELLYREYVNE